MTSTPAPPPAVDAAVPVREGVYGDRVLAVEPGGVEYIADSERHGRAGRLFWTWTSPNLEFATVYVGVLPVALFGGTFWTAVLGIVIGTALGSLLHGLLSTFGPRYGVPQLVQSRATFGRGGNLLPAGLNTLTSGAGWVAVNSVSGAFALQTLAQLLGFGAPPFTLALAVIVLIEIVVALTGHNMVHVVERALAPYLVVVFALCCVYVLAAAHPGMAPNGSAPGGAGAFILATFSAFAYAASWNPYASDYTRYLPPDTPARRVAWSAGLGLFVSCVVLEIAGAGLATVSGTSWGPNDNPTAQFVLPLPHALAVAAMVGIALGAVAANVLNLYSGAMSFLAMGVRLPLRFPRAAMAVVFGALGFAVGLTGNAGPGSKYESFLFFNTYWIVPFVTVVITDWWLRRGRYSEREFFAPARGAGRAGVLAMIVGIAATVPFWNQSPIFVGPVPSQWPGTGDLSFAVGFVVTAAVYVALRRLTTLSAAREPVPAA